LGVRKMHGVEIAYGAADVLFTPLAAVPFSLAGPVDLTFFAAISFFIKGYGNHSFF